MLLNMIASRRGKDYHFPKGRADVPDELAEQFIADHVATRIPQSTLAELVGPEAADERSAEDPPSLGELGVPEAAVVALANAGVTTGDALADYARDKNLQDLPDIGRATERKIRLALDKLKE